MVGLLLRPLLCSTKKCYPLEPPRVAAMHQINFEWPYAKQITNPFAMLCLTKEEILEEAIGSYPVRCKDMKGGDIGSCVFIF
jgi:hypothetical protein